MRRKRKKIAMLLTVTVPHNMTAAQARREVRTLVTHQSFYESEWYDGDIKAIKCRPAKEA